MIPIKIGKSYEKQKIVHFFLSMIISDRFEVVPGF